MKILYVVHSFPPFHWRGTEVYAMELARAQSGRHEVYVFHPRHEPGQKRPVLEEAGFEGLSVFRAAMDIDPANPADYFFNAGQEDLFRGLLGRLRPDIVHFAYYAGGLSLGLASVAKKAGARVFVTVTDYAGICPRGQLLDAENRMCPGPRQGTRCLECLHARPLFEGHSRISALARDWLPPALVRDSKRPELALLRRRLRAAREIFDLAELVIFPAENTRARHRAAGTSPPRSLVMDYGIDLGRFRGHKKTPSEKARVAFIGQLLPHKGLHVLAEAIYSLPDAGNLVCYGNLADPGAEEYIKSLGNYGDRIDFRGTFDFARMEEVLRGIDILVVPSQWHENCPLIVKYAVATGTWAVLADQPGIVARREGIGRARFFDPGDYMPLRRALAEVIGIVESGGETDGFDLERLVRAGALADIAEQARELEKLYEK